MLGTIPFLGPVFSWIGVGVCHVLNLPADVVVGTAKTVCNFIFGGTCQ